MSGTDGDGIFDVSGSFIYDGGQIVLELDNTAAVEHRLLWGPNVDQILADESDSGDVHWALTDHLNTVRDWAQYNDAMDTTSIVNHIVYDVYGNILSETTPSLDAIDLYYTARYFDDATGCNTTPTAGTIQQRESGSARILSGSMLGTRICIGTWGMGQWMRRIRVDCKSELNRLAMERLEMSLREK